MTTIGEQLKQVEDEKNRERIARRSDMLRKFVKEDLLQSLRQRINQGYTDYAPLVAPEEIRTLFAAEAGGQGFIRDHKNSAYYKVWLELDEWAANEDLQIFTGINLTKDNRIRPWYDYDWGGTLKLQKAKPPVKPIPPAPVRPIPPAPRKVIQGASVSFKEVFWLVAFGCFITFLLTYFATRT